MENESIVTKAKKAKKTKKTYLCPSCGKLLSNKEIKDQECDDCGHYLIMENGYIRLPKYRNE